MYSKAKSVEFNSSSKKKKLLTLVLVQICMIQCCLDSNGIQHIFFSLKKVSHEGEY